VTVSDTVTLTREPEREAGRAAELPFDADEAGYRASRRRFTIAVLIGIGIMAIPYLWVLWDLWSKMVDPFRTAPSDFFYDIQARAMFHGHLSVPSGHLGIEGFVHDGRTYTYFGIFPSLIRMPVLLVTSRFDGALTAPSLLAAWLTTALFSSLLLWRLRVVTRGRAVVGRAEAASFGLLMATIMGGSVLMELAATPYVFNEDFAWSVPLTVGCLFALLGMMERPSAGRVWASGVLLVCTNLNRTPAGYAVVIGAVLVGLWFAFGRDGDTNRRWALPMFVVAVVGFGAGAVVTYAKFGTPVGLPMADQVWAQVNAHRRYFLAANDGKAFSLGFLPSTLTAYLQPFGIHFSSYFPYVSTPTAPAAAIHAVLDETYPTASIPPTMPLLFLLACWGTISVFRPKALVPFRLTRIVLLTGAAGTAGVLLWGYIADRYMSDFLPFLIVAGGVGLIEIWRRFEGRTPRARGTLLGIVAVLTVYCVVVNTAIAIGPSEQMSQTQVQNFVSAEKSLSLSSLAASVRHGSTLPDWAPYGQLFMVGNCSGLYLASGIDEADVPGLEIEHYTWIPVEQDPSFSRGIWFTFNHPSSDFTKPVTLLTYGPSKLVLEPDGPGHFVVTIEHSGSNVWPQTTSLRKPISVLHEPFRLQVTIDPNLHQLVVLWFGTYFVTHYIAGTHTPVVQTTKTAPGEPLPEVSVVEKPVYSSMSLCRSLQSGG
jgi:hypothetical protein